MRVSIDTDKCYRAGECYYNHPEILRMQDDGTPELIVAQPLDAAQAEHAKQAAIVCPSGAILLEHPEV